MSFETPKPSPTKEPSSVEKVGADISWDFVETDIKTTPSFNADEVLKNDDPHDAWDSNEFLRFVDKDNVSKDADVMRKELESVVDEVAVGSLDNLDEKTSAMFPLNTEDKPEGEISLVEELRTKVANENHEPIRKFNREVVVRAAEAGQPLRVWYEGAVWMVNSADNSGQVQIMRFDGDGGFSTLEIASRDLELVEESNGVNQSAEILPFAKEVTNEEVKEVKKMSENSAVETAEEKPFLLTPEMRVLKEEKVAGEIPSYGIKEVDEEITDSWHEAPVAENIFVADKVVLPEDIQKSVSELSPEDDLSIEEELEEINFKELPPIDGIDMNMVEAGVVSELVRYSDALAKEEELQISAKNTGPYIEPKDLPESVSVFKTPDGKGIYAKLDPLENSGKVEGVENGNEVLSPVVVENEEQEKESEAVFISDEVVPDKTFIEKIKDKAASLIDEVKSELESEEEVEESEVGEDGAEIIDEIKWTDIPVPDVAPKIEAVIPKAPETVKPLEEADDIKVETETEVDDLTSEREQIATVRTNFEALDNQLKKEVEALEAEGMTYEEATAKTAEKRKELRELVTKIESFYRTNPLELAAYMDEVMPTTVAEFLADDRFKETLIKDGQVNESVYQDALMSRPTSVFSRLSRIYDNIMPERNGKKPTAVLIEEIIKEQSTNK